MNTEYLYQKLAHKRNYLIQFINCLKCETPQLIFKIQFSSY